MFGEQGGAEVDSADVGVRDRDHPEESVEEVNEPSTCRGRGCVVGEKCDVAVVVVKVAVVVVGGEDNKCKALSMNKYVAVKIFMLLMILCDSISSL